MREQNSSVITTFDILLWLSRRRTFFGIFKEEHPCRSPVSVSRSALFSPRVILTKVDSNSVPMWFVTKSLPTVERVQMLRHVYQKILLNLMKAEVLAMQHQFRVGQFPYSVITTRARISTLQNNLPLKKKWAVKYKLQLKPRKKNHSYLFLMQIQTQSKL